jgi:hypothetical protein
MAKQATGKVRRLYVHKNGTSIRLDIPKSEQPEDRYFHLKRDHANYDALYSLALAAAVNRLDISVKTQGKTTVKPAWISYMYVDW